MPPTAFVSHPDCARHDTGWKHPEHQGRLPALVRAVYRDMLALHGHLLEVEAKPAIEADLRLVHTPRLVREVRAASQAAAATGTPRRLAGEVVVSDASWNAALAAVGTALTAIDAVLTGVCRNAFCAARPPGYAAAADRVGGFSLFNTVAIAARHLRRRVGVEHVLVVEWGGIAPGATGALLAGDPGTRVLTVRSTPEGPVAPGVHAVTLPPGSDGELFAATFEAGLAQVLTDFRPDFVLLAAGFDLLSGDPLGVLALEPRDLHGLTRHLGERADRLCDGRLVSILEGGYDPAATGLAVVEHLRALAGLPSLG